MERLDPGHLAEPAGVVQMLDDFVVLGVDIRRDEEALGQVPGCSRFRMTPFLHIAVKSEVRGVHPEVPHLSQRLLP